MSRKSAREDAFKLVFQLNDNSVADILQNYEDHRQAQVVQDERVYALPEQQNQYVDSVVRGVFEHMADLNQIIGSYAENWDIGRISRVAISIIRMALYEMIYLDDVPDAVAINEAVNLAKKYDNPEAASLINGILSKYLKNKGGKDQDGGKD